MMMSLLDCSGVNVADAKDGVQGRLAVSVALVVKSLELERTEEMVEWIAKSLLRINVCTRSDKAEKLLVGFSLLTFSRAKLITSATSVAPSKRTMRGHHPKPPDIFLRLDPGPSRHHPLSLNLEHKQVRI